MATQEGWDDFENLEEVWTGVKASIESLKVDIATLSTLKATLLDVGPKKAAMTPIANQYPNFNMNQIEEDMVRLIALAGILTSNGY